MAMECNARPMCIAGANACPPEDVGGPPDYMDQVVKNIETLIDEGGDISVGPVGGLTCIASASDGSDCLAMLVRRDGEKLDTLMKRLDRAIGLAWSDDVFTDEVNGPA
jgi:hypothetical protein